MRKVDVTSINNSSRIDTRCEDMSSITELFRAHWQRQLQDDEGKLAKQLSYYIPAKLGHVDNTAIAARTEGIAEMNGFLVGNKVALLLLGDSGAGKTLFFNPLLKSCGVLQWNGYRFSSICHT